jgi:O-antigen ligase
LLVATIAVTLFGFYQYMIGDYSSLYEALYPIQDEALKNPPWAGRITSFLSHYNGLAAYLNMVIPVCMGLAVRAKDKFSRVLAWTCFVFSSFALLLTQSRGGLLAYVAILLLSAYLLPRRGKARLRWIAAVLVFSLSGALLVGQIFTRLQGVDLYTEVTRLGIWAGAGLVFAGNPVIGVGYGNFKTALTSAIAVPDGYMLDAHNLYLELLAETGIIGFVAFAILIIASVRCARRMFRSSDEEMISIAGFAVIAAIAGVLVHGMVEYVFHNSPQCAAMFFLLVSLAGAYELKTSRISQTRSATANSQQLSTSPEC